MDKIMDKSFQIEFHYKEKKRGWHWVDYEFKDADDILDTVMYYYAIHQQIAADIRGYGINDWVK